MIIKPKLNNNVQQDILEEEEDDEWVLLGPDGQPYREDKLYLWRWESWADQGIEARQWVPPEYYGPTAKQYTAWVEETKQHLHPLDVRGFIGAGRSGKTQGIVGRFLYLARMFPGVKLCVGGIDYEYLRTSMIETDYRTLLTLPGQAHWSHPFVLKHPTREYKQLDFANGSVIYFRNLEEDLNKVLGMGVEGVHFEQPELFTDFDTIFETFVTRMSGRRMGGRRCIYFSANPFMNLEPIERRFDLDQLDPDYNGPPRPVGKACRCHLCNTCDLKNVEVEWVKRKCPNCGAKKDPLLKCPGRQQFQWIVHCNPEDNAYNVPATYHADQKALMSSEKYEQLAKGVIRKVGKGKCYPNFSMRNCIGTIPTVKMDRDIYWTHDFNNHPMCNSMFQIDNPELKEAYPDITVFDEQRIWGGNAVAVANRFIETYGHIVPEFRGYVRINGDPMGKTRVDMIDNRFIQIKKKLESAGFKVIIDVLPTWYKCTDRIETTNFFLQDGERCRVKISTKKAPHLIKSLDQITWDRTGKKEDQKYDNKARDSKQYHDGIVHAMTHPAAALGYALHRHWPAVAKNAGSGMIINVNTGMITDIDDGEITHRSMTAEEIREYGGVSEDMEGIEYDFASLDEWETYLPGAGKKQKSTADEFRQMGLWTPKGLEELA